MGMGSATRKELSSRTLTFSFDVVGVANDSTFWHCRVVGLCKTENKRQNVVTPGARGDWGRGLPPQLRGPQGHHGGAGASREAQPALTMASSISAVPSRWPLMLMTSSIRPVIW